MKKVKQALTSLSFFVLGFLMAFLGVSKPDLAEAAIQDMKARIAFGQKNSPIEVYFVTDWFCPSCTRVEPEIESVVPKIHPKVTYYFIDYPIHSKSLNFSPYNLSFLVHNKLDYFKARAALAKLAEKNDSPTDMDVIKTAKEARIPFQDLSFLDVKAGLDYFDKVVQHYELDSTPTVVITNTRTNKTQKLEGSNEISEEKILKAIENLQK